ncbi:rod shape-determining protein MreC [Lactiplantibacillus plantarum]|uniref:rod shape-determining protein MreC n=1 Tax=Lactiplantibacillus plantarum TaxID=1590 RepID=UPI0025B59BC3|nr:rod shape-determining protein MreC [Lactiplantibacillus plantarum]MDN3984191.1 rod shape-determining protein MreC [Lactiplantibacillus plantarum]
MQKFFSNRKLVIAIVVFIISFGLMSVSVAIRDKKSTPPLIQQFGNDVAGAVDRVIAWPVNGLQSATNSVSDLLNTYQENQKLKKQVDQLAQAKVSAQTTRAENKQLRKQLKLNNSLSDYTTVTANVLTRTPSSWMNQLVISKGATSGVKKNMPVMSQKGLIGRVVEVNQTNSKVELISNTSSSSNKFAIQITNSAGKTVNGIISGYDKSNNLLEMGSVTSNVKIKKGDKVVTSGLGGNTPKGLYVGTVASVKQDDYGLAFEVEITPAADLSDLTVVTVAEQ